MHIACATDDGYAPHCATMLRSLLDRNPPADLSIHVLHGDTALSADSKDRLRDLVNGTGASLHFIPLGARDLEGFPSGRFHISCWYRVLLPHARPDLDRILYLDSDMVVLDDLRPLWETDLHGKLFAAVVNPLYPFMPDRAVQTLGLPTARSYLNSGVMLMDLGAMRAAGLTEKLRDYGAAHPDHAWPEQDALSAVCRDRWLALPPRWNAQTTLFDLKPAQLPFTADEVRAARKNPAVVHFIGPLKPWHYLCRHPYRREYQRLRKRTPWPDLRLEGRTLKNALLRPFPLGVQLQLRALARRLRQRWARHRARGPRLLRRMGRLLPHAVFVQVGSNDGSKHDPLRATFLRTRWTGVLVEPVPYVFERLKANYARYPRARLENAAIAERSGALPFYHLRPAAPGEALPDWYDELGSFRKDVILSHADRIPALESRLVSTEVRCLRFDELCEKHGLAAVDLIHTDAEGYDDVILDSIDLARWRPRLVIYEHKHLARERRERCAQRFARLGFECFSEGQDTWCVDARPRDAAQRRLLDAWRGLVA